MSVFSTTVRDQCDQIPIRSRVGFGKVRIGSMWVQVGSARLFINQHVGIPNDKVSH